MNIDRLLFEDLAMKKFTAFTGLCALEGLLVLLPILLFILLLMEIVSLVVGLATPIADLFPAGTFDDPEHPVALAVSCFSVHRC
jgi:hypothetical protein